MFLQVSCYIPLLTFIDAAKGLLGHWSLFRLQSTVGIPGPLMTASSRTLFVSQPLWLTVLLISEAHLARV